MFFLARHNKKELRKHKNLVQMTILESIAICFS